MKVGPTRHIYICAAFAFHPDADTQGYKITRCTDFPDGIQVTTAEGMHPAYEEKQALPFIPSKPEEAYEDPVDADTARTGTTFSRWVKHRFWLLLALLFIIIVSVSVSTGVAVSKNTKFVNDVSIVKLLATDNRIVTMRINNPQEMTKAQQTVQARPRCLPRMTSLLAPHSTLPSSLADRMGRYSKELA